MAEEPSDVIVAMLRQIHTKFGDHDRRFDALEEDLRELREGQEEFLRNCVYAMGTPAGAHHRVVDVEAELEALKMRLSKLEEKA